MAKKVLEYIEKNSVKFVDGDRTQDLFALNFFPRHFEDDGFPYQVARDRL
jgi:hypothetical protein